MDFNSILTKVINYEYLHIHFCYQNDDNEYISLTPDISSDVKNEINGIIQNNLNRYESYSQVEYNQTGGLDGTVETCATADFEIVSDLVASFDRPQSGEINPKEISFLVYEIQYEDEKIYFMRRHNKLKSFRKGFFGYLRGGRFNSINSEEFLGVDDKIDLIVYEDDIAIFYHTSFERIFNLSEQFIETATEVLENQLFLERIEGFNELKEDLLGNMNYVKRVSRLVEAETSLLFLQNLEETQNVIDEFDLDIRVNEHQKLVYRDKTQLGNFINLMQDSYYKTLIGNDRGVDERK